MDIKQKVKDVTLDLSLDNWRKETVAWVRAALDLAEAYTRNTSASRAIAIANETASITKAMMEEYRESVMALIDAEDAYRTARQKLEGE